MRLGSSLIIFLLFFFYFYVSWSKITSILIEINNGQSISLMLYFFRILALEKIVKILTTGPRLHMRMKLLNMGVGVGGGGASQ